MASNLPPQAAKGVFSVTLSKVIDAPIDKVWGVLLDFPSYGEWNPFVRSMAIVTSSKKPETDQSPVVGKHLLMHCHIPPSMEEKKKQTAFEVVTAVDTENHRVAWQNIDYPSWLMHAERWQALSTVDGKTRYETTEVFTGILAYVVKWYLRESLEKSFAAMADGLKQRSEQA